MPHSTPTIGPLTLYSLHDVSAMCDASLRTLARARRDRALRAVRKGRRLLILGRWLLEWLERDDEEGTNA
jgi:hypothetical protein